VAATTADAAAARVQAEVMRALQSAGVGGALPAGEDIPAVVGSAVGALSPGSDAAQGQRDANTIFGLGRSQQMRAEGVERYLYSTLLESQSCEPCRSHDGEVFGADRLDDYATPASWCEGGDLCNCLIIGLLPDDAE